MLSLLLLLFASVGTCELHVDVAGDAFVVGDVTVGTNDFDVDVAAFVVVTAFVDDTAIVFAAFVVGAIDPAAVAIAQW